MDGRCNSENAYAWNQPKKLADLTGYTYQYISMTLKGHKNTKEAQQRICDAIKSFEDAETYDRRINGGEIMFYLKTKKGKFKKIHADNVYTICPDCGGWHQVDLMDIPRKDLDLYATQCFCPGCSRDRLKKEGGRQ